MATHAPSPWTRSPWTDAAQLAELIDPDAVPDQARGQPPHAWFSRLVGQGKQFDAIMFVALALPRYDCVVWATQSLLRMGALDRTDPAATAALRWIDDPSDALRRAADETAARVKYGTAGQMLLKAVFFSGGSLAPAELPAVQPQPDICGRMAGGAVLTGAYALSDPQRCLTDALRLGEATASGG